MFLDSVWAGIASLRHWQVLFAAVAYVSLLFAFKVSVGLLMAKKESKSEGSGFLAGCFGMLVGDVLNGVLMALLIAFVLPTILGGGGTTRISFIREHALRSVGAGVLAIAVVFLLGMMPIIGNLIDASAGLQAFLQGVIIFRLLAGAVLETSVKAVVSSAQLYPSLVESVGFLIISGAMTWVITAGVAAAGARFLDEESPILLIAGVALGSVGGILPLLMYGSYVRLALK